MPDYRYVLLCRHAAHIGGELKAEKGADELWRFPPSDVALALAEKVQFGGADYPRLKKIVYAPTPESARTAALLVRALRGEPVVGTRELPAQPTWEEEPTVPAAPTARLLQPIWRWRRTEPKKDPKPSYRKDSFNLETLDWMKPAASSAPTHDRDRAKDGHGQVAAPASVATAGKTVKGGIGRSIVYQPWQCLLPDRADEAKEVAKGIVDTVEALVVNGAVSATPIGGAPTSMTPPAAAAGNQALLVVGHQPQLGWISAYLAGRTWIRRGRHAVAMASSEIVCLQFPFKRGKLGRCRVLWTIVPGEKAVLEAISEKVKGKMESAKLLSAVITLLLTAFLALLLDHNKWNGLHDAEIKVAFVHYKGEIGVQLSFLFLLAALALYLATMYSYDTLLMPPRFWSDDPRRRRKDGRPGRFTRRHRWLPERPPSSSAVVVHRNMLRVWDRLFTVANALVAAAVITAAGPLLHLQGGWLLLGGIAAAGALVFGWMWWFRPVLGSHD